ncbi:hypothetical protein A5697_13470 [Mycobacterium sp. E3251]|nr:hypothetical protein A5697_13470 [Mycobacterium sp. E3251]OBI23980.1 hypothetical protein A5711_09155 [Mycobacterium sp. E2238]
MRIKARQLAALIAVILAAVAATRSTGMTEPRSYRLISTSTPPVPPTPLVPNDHGYVRVTLASRAISCSISAELVACQTSSDSWPPRGNGQPFHAVSVSADGKFQFVEADLGALAGKVELQPGAYEAQGWTVAATGDSFVFTNDHTGHGMEVSTQAARPV